MEKTKLSRRTVLQAAVATTALAAPFVRGAAAVQVVPRGSMVLAWHTNIAPRWLDPLQHDGGATPDNFLNAVHDALIKNFRNELYDHLAPAERYEFAEDSKSATSGCGRASNSKMAPPSRRKTSNGVRELPGRLGSGAAR